MGNFEQCCRDKNEYSETTSKLARIHPQKSQNLFDNSSYALTVFDIDRSKLFSRKISLRIINSLSGITQITVNNALYLCGVNKKGNQNGSFLLKYDIANLSGDFSPEINSFFPHYKPVLFSNEDELFIIGGFRQKLCEKYNFTRKKYKQFPPLSEERYLSSCCFDRKNCDLYLFGGFTNMQLSDNILCVNVKGFLFWRAIALKDNANMLARFSAACFTADSKIYILGGKTGEGLCLADILEYNIVGRTLKRRSTGLGKPTFFEANGEEDDTEAHFVALDENNNIVKVEKAQFRVSLFPY